MYFEKVYKEIDIYLIWNNHLHSLYKSLAQVNFKTRWKPILFTVSECLIQQSSVSFVSL